MPLRTHFERSGNWLFRRRSYIPLFLIGTLMPSIIAFRYTGGHHSYDLQWVAFCFLVSLFGLAIRVHAIGHVPAGTSGRNTKDQVAVTLNTSGLYSVMRHPLYAGNYLMWLGVSLFVRVWWCPILISLVFWLCYERIMYAEEEFLFGKFGDAWRDWATRTPAFVPALRLWRAPEMSFSIHNVLKREYSALFGIVAVFTLCEVVGDTVQYRRLVFDPVWSVIFVGTLGIYILLRTLKRQTRWLHISGR